MSDCYIVKAATLSLLLSLARSVKVSVCRMGDLLYKLTSLKFQEPSQGEEIIKDHCENVRMELADRFRALEEEFR